MNRVTVAGITALSLLAVALVLGTQWLRGNPEGPTVVTVLGLLGLGISQLIGNKDAADAAKKTEEISHSLHNGTFERLIREALEKIAKESDNPLEINREERGGESDG